MSRIRGAGGGVAVAGLVAVAALAAVALATPASGEMRAVDARGAGQCTNSELVASYRSTGAGMSHAYGRIVLENVSDHACRTGGYGGISYVGDGDGTQIGAAADRTDGRVRAILVRPGQRVVSPLDAVSAAPYPRRRCRPAHVDGFRVYVPDETRSQYVPHRTTGCRSHRVGLLSHKPYRRP